MREKVLILGYGVSGKSAAKAAKNAGYSVTVYDDNAQSPKDHQLSMGFNFIDNKEEILNDDYKYIIKSPGITPYSEVIKYIKSNDLKIISDLEWAYILKGDSKLITITGTNGKTTTTVLIDMIMRAGGYTTEIAGNIGIGAPEIFQESKADYIIVEASSFQLMDIDTYRSDITVITNITTDHLDYHGSREDYVKSKLNILQNLSEVDPIIINGDDKELFNLCSSAYQVSEIFEPKMGLYLKNGIIYNNGQEILDTSNIKMVGLHNYYNIMEAIQVGLLHGIDKETIRSSIKDFPGVEHRLEYITIVDGVKYYNDSKGTNTSSTLYAINSFDEDIILILGGYDKKEDYSPIIELAKDKIKHIVAIGQTKDKIKTLGQKLDYNSITTVEDLELGMKIAKEIASRGDVILLSPASASWGMYKDYIKRGDHFKSLI